MCNKQSVKVIKLIKNKIKLIDAKTFYDPSLTHLDSKAVVTTSNKIDLLFYQTINNDIK